MFCATRGGGAISLVERCVRETALDLTPPFVEPLGPVAGLRHHEADVPCSVASPVPSEQTCMSNPVLDLSSSTDNLSAVVADAARAAVRAAFADLQAALLQDSRHAPSHQLSHRTSSGRICRLFPGSALGGLLERSIMRAAPGAARARFFSLHNARRGWLCLPLAARCALVQACCVSSPTSLTTMFLAHM